MPPQKIILFFLCCILTLDVSAQKIKVTFRVRDKDNVPVPFAAMQVSSVADSVNDHDEGSCDSNGRMAFTLAQGQKYVVRMFAVNYKPLIKSIIVKGEHPVFSLVAESDTKALGDVEIAFKKPLLRQEEDKTIVDPEELAQSSTSAYDIMEKIPGLFVDQDGNIYITSTTPATIYINGREQKMSNADVAAMLKSLPPNSIDRIEILRTPNSKYDASSSGGIVNVILKKGVHIGITGSANGGMNQGTYGNQFAGFMISNNTGKWNTTLNLQASHRETGERLETNRTVSSDSLFAQNAYTRYPSATYFGYYSVAYTPNPKWDITCDGRISTNNNQSNSSSPATISAISTGAEAVQYNTGLSNNASNVNITQGINLKYKPDTSGSEWTTDLSYNYIPTNTSQNYNTDYTFPVADSVSGNGNIHTHLQFVSLHTDIIKKLPFRITLETGIKMSGVWFDNNTNYNISHNGTTANDTTRTNSFSYDELIYSAYLQASKDFHGILVKAGTRLENTNMDGNQTVPVAPGYKINRTDLFPYIYISRKVMKIAGYELRSYLIYKKTITRPSYEYLNPFPKYVDQYLSEVGNPSLKPQFTQTYEANISVDERPLLAIGYNDITDMFSQVIYQSPTDPRQTYRTYDNLGSNKEVFLRGLGAIPPGKVYFFVLGAQYNHNLYDGQYDSAPLHYQHDSWTFFTYQTLRLSKLTQLVLNGFLRYKSQINFYELSTFGSLNMSINHQFVHKKLKVTMSITDMFGTNYNNFTINQGDINAYGLRKGDTRRLGLNASYNFGVRKKEEHNFMKVETPEGESEERK